MIKTKDLTKYYGKSRGIEKLNLEVNQGEIFGFIGPNGAGKSTTVRTLLNLIFPTSGQGKIFDLDIVKDTVKIRKDVGYVPAEVHFYSDMIVKDFIQYSTKFYCKDYQDFMEELAQKLELDLSRKIGDLSSGNKKKVAIVIAMVFKPKLLIFDEPTSGLDPLIQSKFFQLLKDAKKDGTTIFFSSHVLSVVQKICDRVGIIKEGQLIKVEKISQILKTKAKNIRIVSEELELEKTDDMKNFKHINDTYYFTYTGDISDLLNQIKASKIDDMSMTEPSLDEVFLHYYKAEEQS